jgi:hypothetical protein
MDAHGSDALLSMVDQGSMGATASQVLRAYVRQNRDVLWSEALADHDLL